MPPPAPAPEQDAPRRHLIYYAIGNIENGLANQFFGVLAVITVVALGMSPLLIGLIISLKTILDGITDPVMAQISDNARTRWGRRIPFIFVGGISRVLLVTSLFLFFPFSDTIKTNAEYQKEKRIQESAMRSAAEAPTAPGAVGVPTPPTLRTPPPPPPSLITKIGNGLSAITTADNPYHRKVFYYLLFFSLAYALLSTIQSVPYYALGIEIAPSYDGRTRAVVYRSYADKAMSLVTPWILPFAFLPMFPTVLDGLVLYGVAVSLVGIPTTIAMCAVVKEPGYSSSAARKPGPSLFRSIWLTMRNRHFLKILFLYVFIGLSNGIFAQFGTFLILYWVFAGDMLQGATVNGWQLSLGTILAFVSLPLIQWACRRFSKHATLRFAIIWMAIGAALKWFVYDPAHPWLLLILPFFFSIGISSVFTILPTLMADVTDIDELEVGVRREAMFGAVMAFLQKAITSFQPLLAAVVLTASGFEASRGLEQAEGVFYNMRLLASWVPAGLLLLAIIVLIRYPLTRARMDEVKSIIAARRAAATQTES